MQVCCERKAAEFKKTCRDRRLRGAELCALFGALLGLIIFASIVSNYANAGVYELNLPLAPRDDPRCTRSLPQYSRKISSNEARRQMRPQTKCMFCVIALPFQISQFAFQLYCFALLLLFSAYIVAAVCALRLHLFLREAKMSKFLRRAQRSISRIIAAQASF